MQKFNNKLKLCDVILRYVHTNIHSLTPIKKCCIPILCLQQKY